MISAFLYSPKLILTSTLVILGTTSLALPADKVPADGLVSPDEAGQKLIPYVPPPPPSYSSFPVPLYLVI